MFGWLGALAGVVLLLMGIFLVFFFPAAGEHQYESQSILGVAMGVLFFIIGFVLIFLP